MRVGGPKVWFGTLVAVLVVAGLGSLSAVREAGRAPTDVRLVVRAAECEFRTGFKALRDQIPQVVGECLENERHSIDTGDGLQRTTNGLLVWRKADNWTAFTDGHTTWLIGPFGLQSRLNGERFPWEASMAEPTQTPEPWTGNPLVQLVVADAAQRTGLPPASIRVISVEPREWPDASLGCPRPGMAYAQVITPGYLMLLDAGGQQLEYHTDARQRLVLC